MKLRRSGIAAPANSYRLVLETGDFGRAVVRWVSEENGKPVRFITGAAAGSSGDILARALGDQVSATWKQPVVIENRPGGGGVIASQALLAAPADGHTVFIAAGSYLTITPASRWPYSDALR